MTGSLTCMMIPCLRLFLSGERKIDRWIEKASVGTECFLKKHLSQVSESADYTGPVIEDCTNMP